MELKHSAMVTSDDIYNDLCYKIEKLQYMPGQGISENELCKQYNVSRHMVRGALTKLKQRRLIEVYPQRGTFVSLIDMEYIGDILYLRESIEQEAMQRVIQKDDIKELCNKMRESIRLQAGALNSEGYSDEFYKLDTEFHGYILQEIGKNEVLELVAEPYIHIRRWRNFEVRSLERMHQLILEHEAIVNAMEAKEPMKAREALHIHLDTIGRYGQTIEDAEKQYFFK